MARANPLQSTFNTGEFSPRMVARFDFAQYAAAGSLIENLTAFPEGGLTKRPGSRFMAEVKDSGDLTILLPFEFSSDQTYILELGDLYMRFYRNQGRIEAPAGEEAWADGTLWTDGTGWLDSEGAEGPVEIATPYSSSELYQLKYAQSADVMWIVHPSHKPKKLTRTSHTAWTLTDYTPTGDPFTSADNYPAAVSFFEQRLFFASTNAEPQTVWATASADYENMDLTVVPVVDDHPFKFAIAVTNRIRWLSAGRTLVVGTLGGEVVIESSGPFLTPTDFNVREHTALGSADIMPIRSGHQIVMLQRGGRKVHELVSRFEEDGLVSTNLTRLSEHVTESCIVQMAYAPEPDSVVWCVRGDGQLAAMTYRREEEGIVAWTRHTLGGSFGSGAAVVESVAVIQGQDGAGQVFSSLERSEVWMTVKRTIDSVTKRYFEMLERQFVGPRRQNYETDTALRVAMLAEQTDAFYVDSGLTYDGAAVGSLSGLDHLEGETVAILGDGAILPDQVVAGGAISFESGTGYPTTVSKAQVGLPMRWRFWSLKLAYGATAGTAIAKVKRAHQLGLVLDTAATFEIGVDEDHMSLVEFRLAGDPMDTAVPLFTGEIIETLEGGFERDPRIKMMATNPSAFTLLAMAPEMETHDVK